MLTTVALLEGSTRYRTTIARTIRDHARDLEIVANIATLSELMRIIEGGLQPDVVLAGGDPAEQQRARTRLRHLSTRGTAIVLFSDDEGVRQERTASLAQVTSLPRNVTVSALVRAIRSAHLGRTGRPQLSRLTTALTAREQLAVRLYVQGLTLAEVAAVMSVGRETAKTFIRRAREKYSAMGRVASTREQLVDCAAGDRRS